MRAGRSDPVDDCLPPDLTAFGRDLERRGYRTLSSIAFLTEEDVEGVTDLELRQLLLTTLSRLRHELFRM